MPYSRGACPPALPKSVLGRSLHYALEQRLLLETFYLDGRLEISNNMAERSIKPFVIGRKNWLFSCSPKRAETSAVIYSINNRDSKREPPQTIRIPQIHP
ncbi:IS66 family transposase [Cloacibacillus sp.]